LDLYAAGVHHQGLHKELTFFFKIALSSMNPTTTANSMPDNNNIFSSPMQPSIVVDIDMECGELHSMGATNSLFYKQTTKFSNERSTPEVSSGLNRPDLYQEGFMVGPCILSTPVVFATPSNAVVASSPEDSAMVIETAGTFNNALDHHSSSNAAAAMKRYRTCVNNVINVLKEKRSRCRAILEIGMRAHNNIGQIAYVNGNYKAAAAHFQASLLFSKQLLGKICTSENHRNQLEHATILSNQCRVLWRRGEVSATLYSGLQDVLRVRSSVLPWNHLDVAAAHYNLGVCEFAKMNNQKAVEHLMQYLKVAAANRLMSSQESDLDVIPALSYLLLIQNAHTEEDSWTSQLLLSGILILQGKNHHVGAKPPVSHDGASAIILNGIASLLFNKGDMEMSLLFFQEELRVIDEERFHGNNTMCVSIACHNIGRVFQEMQHDEQAVSYYERALKPIYGGQDIGDYNSLKTLTANKADLLSIFKRNFLSTVWYNLGRLHAKLASRTQAICAFEIALELKQCVLNSDYVDITCLKFNIGVLHIEENRPDAASKYLEQVVVARREYLERTGRRMDKLADELCVRALQKLVVKYKKQNTNSINNIQAVINTLREVLCILINSTEFDSVSRAKEMALVLQSLSEHYYTLSNLPSALVTARDGVRELELYARMTIDHESTTSSVDEKLAIIEQLLSSMLKLGSLHHEMCEPIEAHAVYQRALAMIQLATVTPLPQTCPESLCKVCEVIRIIGRLASAPAA
jgi:tetratricopeptide (TPR) repeat protein